MSSAGRPHVPTSTTVTVHVPIKFARRGGRKRVIAPIQPPVDNEPIQRAQGDDALVKMIVRAFRWQRLLDSDSYESIQALAAAERIDKSYMSKILRLTTLAPMIVEMILDGEQPETLNREALLRPFPAGWDGQQDALSANWVSLAAASGLKPTFWRQGT